MFSVLRKQKQESTSGPSINQEDFIKELDNFFSYLWNEIHDISAAVFEQFFSWFKQQLRRLYVPKNWIMIYPRTG